MIRNWVDVERACKAAGLSKAEFCRLAPVSPAAFYTGLKRNSRLSMAVRAAAERVFEQRKGTAA